MRRFLTSGLCLAVVLVPSVAALQSAHADVLSVDFTAATKKTSLDLDTADGNGGSKGDYFLGRKLGAYWGPNGDSDGDGVTNRAEYVAHIGDGTPAFVAAALDPGERATEPANSTVFWCPMRGRPCAKVDYPKAGTCNDCGMPLITKAAYEEMEAKRGVNAKTVGIVLFDGFESLDVYGPVEMWGYVQEFNLVTVAETAGPVTSSQGLATVAQYGFADCPPLDIVFVPGGIGTRRELRNEVLLEFIRKRNAKAELTVSVCTGSALLAKAGVLDGHRATSNKVFLDLAKAQSDRVEWVGEARWVDDGPVITSSGVSAGMDMALHVIRRLFGEERARKIAEGAEYIWNDDPDRDPFHRPTQ